MSNTIKGWLYLAIAVVAIVILAGIAGWIYEAGITKERAAWQGEEVQRQADLTKQLQAEYERGKAASTRYQLGASALQTNYLQLQGPANDLRTRVPLVLPAAVRRAVPSCRDEHVAGDLGHAPAVQAPVAEPPGEVRSRPGDVDQRLSLAAVWMWNSALAGADTPAGSCGLADTSSEACASDSGLSLDDAWENQRVNSQSCAADRLRFRSLIEFLNERPIE